MKCLKALKANRKGLIALFIVTAALGIAAGLTAVLGIEEKKEHLFQRRFAGTRPRNVQRQFDF